MESPSFASHELISIATELNNIAWINSGLENHGPQVNENASHLTAFQGAATALQTDFSEQGLKNDYARFAEKPGQFLGVMSEVLSSTQMARQPFTMPAEV